MLQQAYDFFYESESLYNLLENLSDKELETQTLFKRWTFNNIIRHLHVWNYALNLSLKGGPEWEGFLKELYFFLDKGKGMKDFEQTITNKAKGRELLNIWKNYYTEITEKFKLEDPKRRVKWVGPDMSVISSISARHMETWAHGQSIFDSLGLKRKNKDSILNIVIIGNNTFKWSYKVNKIEVPLDTPYLKLVSPTGKIWEFNNSKNNNIIEGAAEEFCQVVTQVRNIDDVNLKIKGPISKEWLSIAQCFAGNAESPPKPGSRGIK